MRVNFNKTKMMVSRLEEKISSMLRVNQNQFYFRRKNTMLIEQQLACDKGKAAKGPKWSSSQE